MSSALQSGDHFGDFMSCHKAWCRTAAAPALCHPQSCPPQGLCELQALTPVSGHPPISVMLPLFTSEGDWGWQWNMRVGLMTKVTIPSGGILLVSSNGSFRLLLASLERCSGDRKRTSDLPLLPSPWPWLWDEAMWIKWWRVLLPEKMLLCFGLSYSRENILYLNLEVESYGNGMGFLHKDSQLQFA